MRCVFLASPVIKYQTHIRHDFDTFVRIPLGQIHIGVSRKYLHRNMVKHVLFAVILN